MKGLERKFGLPTMIGVALALATVPAYGDFSWERTYDTGIGDVDAHTVQDGPLPKMHTVQDDYYWQPSNSPDPWTLDPFHPDFGDTPPGGGGGAGGGGGGGGDGPPYPDNGIPLGSHVDMAAPPPQTLDIPLFQTPFGRSGSTPHSGNMILGTPVMAGGIFDGLDRTGSGTFETSGPAPVPAPGTVALLGLASLVSARRRRRA